MGMTGMVWSLVDAFSRLLEPEEREVVANAIRSCPKAALSLDD